MLLLDCFRFGFAVIRSELFESYQLLLVLGMAFCSCFLPRFLLFWTSIDQLFECGKLNVKRENNNRSRRIPFVYITYHMECYVQWTYTLCGHGINAYKK